MRKLPVSLLFFLSFLGVLKAQESPVGAWKSISGRSTSILLITPSWFTVTDYSDKTFLASYGGTWKPAGNGEAEVTVYYNTANGEQAGQSAHVPIGIINGQLQTSGPGGGQQIWTRLDNGAGSLAGNWMITAREKDGKKNPVPDGPRQTFKLLTGTRFQWVAINVQTGEFFGSGGGTYTFEEGLYKEKIEFFSRDSSRVGTVLSFKGKVTGNEWDHSGVSTKGDPIHETWSRNQD
ncbi:hypothetical protein ACDQ55_10835 [Chitinophaga sp. 30R24]|uniref:hypothetical protein n=1 Tax=Chitinophaga sp. 30R24 TaxID=3248838 RepID=UPI003B905D5A